MNGKQTHFDWSFGLQWLVSCALGTATDLGMMWVLRRETAVAI